MVFRCLSHRYRSQQLVSVPRIADTATRGTATAEYDAWWNRQRTKTVTELNGNINDRSNKGIVDIRIVPLLSYINAHPDYFSLSSCSGRVSLFHRLSSTPTPTQAPLSSGGTTGLIPPLGTVEQLRPPLDPSSTASATGKAKRKRGHGHGTIWSSHDPVEDVDAVAKELVLKMFDLQQPDGSTDSGSGGGGEAVPITQGVVEMKFEPMLLHIRCKTNEAADALITVASNSGHRRSGIWRSPFKVQSVSTPMKRTAPPRGPGGGGGGGAGAGSATITSDNKTEVLLSQKGGGAEGYHRITASINCAMGYSTPLLVNGLELVPGILSSPNVPTLGGSTGEGTTTTTTTSCVSTPTGAAAGSSSSSPLFTTLQRHLIYANQLMEENYQRTARFEGELRKEWDARRMN